jgi:nucleoside-diphosphate-sugar epimerase
VRVRKTASSAGEAYCYAKVRQEEMVMEYGRKYNIPYVILRPGAVYGPGNKGITGRSRNQHLRYFPFIWEVQTESLSYVDNCADAIVGWSEKGIDGKYLMWWMTTFRQADNFSRMYKKT